MRDDGDMKSDVTMLKKVSPVSIAMIVVAALFVGCVGLSTPQLTPTTSMLYLSGGPSPDTPLVVDADLEVMVNGKTVFLDDDRVNTSDGRAWWKGTPIPFFASPGDTLRIIATNPGGTDIELSELYLHVKKGQSLKLTDGVTRRSSEIYTFFDQNFTIPIHNGSISISSTPSGAQVFFDGVYKGTTPLSLEDVICKSYTIMIVKGGYYRETRKISLDAGKTIKLDIPLRQYAGSISVSSSPSGASVYLNGIYKGITPITLTDVPPGDYSITLTKSGYYNRTKRVSVSIGETTHLDETLKEKTTSTPQSVVTPTQPSMVTPTPPMPTPPMPTPQTAPFPSPLQILVTPNPVEAGKPVTLRVKDERQLPPGVEGAKVYYAISTDAIKTGSDVVKYGEYIGTTTKGGWLSYTFEKPGVYAIGIIHNGFSPIEYLTVTEPAPIPIAIEKPTLPVLPVSPEYLYIIPIALFLILLPLIFYTRRKKKKPATSTPEKPSPPSPEQKESERQKVKQAIKKTTARDIEKKKTPLTLERAIYDPCKRDFIERPLPRMKEWINRYDPGAYWFAVSIQNNTDRAIEEWGVELETSSALKIKEAKIEGIEIEIPHEAHLNSFKISVPKEYGIVIPKGSAQRVYFKLRAEKPKTTYEISGVFKSAITSDVPIRQKEFKYLCDAGVSSEAVKAELKKTFSEKDAARLANTFRIAQEIRSSYCNTDTTAREINKEFDVLKMYLTENEFLDEVEGIQRKINAELREDERLDDKHVKEVKDFCEKFTEMWIARFLR